MICAGVTHHKSNSPRPRLRSLRHSTPSTGATKAYASSCLSWLVTRTETCPVFFEFRLARPDTWQNHSAVESAEYSIPLLSSPKGERLPRYHVSNTCTADREMLKVHMYGSSQGGSAHLRLRRDVGLRADVAADGQVVAELHQAGLQLQRTRRYRSDRLADTCSCFRHQ